MKNKILSNISFNFLIKAITYTFSALAVLYVARILQPEAFGRISFASSFAGYFIMIANLGMPIYAMRAAAQKRENRAELSAIFHELWSIHALLSAAGMAVFLIVILAVPRLREDLPLLLIYGTGQLSLLAHKGLCGLADALRCLLCTGQAPSDGACLSSRGGASL
jgi:O-antigen/teichoic acid export membrane protein